MFEIGGQVVCIIGNDGYWYDFRTQTPTPGPHPQKGGVYTIRWITTYPGCKALGFDFEEILGDNQYRSDHFRPVKKTSIEIFTKVLAPAPKVDA